MGRIEAMLKILDVEGADTRDGTRWKPVPGASWSYDGERYAQVTALRRAEQEAMARFGSDGRCLMRALQEELDDPSPSDCGRCSVCAGPRYATTLDPALVEAAGRHLRSKPVGLEVKKMAPDAAGVMRKIPDDVRLEPGWALARFGDGGWWPAIQRGLGGGEFEADVVAALADVIRAGGERVSWLTWVPSVSLGDALPRLGERVARGLGVPAVALVERTGDRPPQREMANAAQQAANVRGAFRVVGRPPAGAGVLLDDRRHSGWTLAMVGGQLRKAGAERVVPVALASL
jgi:ATP-dependent DNA helicase RecQ